MDLYGEGFAAVYSSDHYGLFSRRLAKIALELIDRHGVAGRQLLDLACGAGAGTVLFAEAGYSVSSIDQSATMIQQAAQRIRAKGINVSLYRQDMRTFTLPYCVDVVTCLFDALNYMLREDEIAQVFAGVARVLLPGGLFVFDMNTLHGLANRWGTRDAVFTARPDLFEVNQYRFHKEAGINVVTTTIFVRQMDEEFFKRYTEIHRERGYSPETIAGLLTEAGFEILSMQGLAEKFLGLANGLQPLTKESGRMVVTARRSSALGESSTDMART